MVAQPVPTNAAVAGPPDELTEAERSSGKAGAPTVLVRYGAMGWVGEFASRQGPRTNCQGPVVVQTDRGIELGQPLLFCSSTCPIAVPKETIRTYVQTSGPEFCRANAGRILREATPQDVNEHVRLNAHPREDLELCADLAGQLGLDIKIVAAEHLLGGERIVFYFRSEGRVDFRELVKELAHRFHTRIEMRQVGARDEARLLADWEVCGRECCCKNFLKKLRPVNMKMAKLQKSTLDPSKVSGRCGRLRCCLRYEHEGYTELAAKLPRRGTRVRTPLGVGTVIDHQVLTLLVLVRTDEANEFAVPLEQILEFNLPRPRPAAPAADERGKPAAVASPLPVRSSGREADRDVRKRRPADKPPAPDAARPDDQRSSTQEAKSPAESSAGQTANQDSAETPGKPRGIRRRRGGRRRNRRRPGADREPAQGT
jgi:cell fate regulator YaaT (PSP1 superfamily)